MFVGKRKGERLVEAGHLINAFRKKNVPYPLCVETRNVRLKYDQIDPKYLEKRRMAVATGAPCGRMGSDNVASFAHEASI